LFADINAGGIKITIGSTQKMGTGVNAQRRLTEKRSAGCDLRSLYPTGSDRGVAAGGGHSGPAAARRRPSVLIAQSSGRAQDGRRRRRSICSANCAWALSNASRASRHRPR
jgi:hypothetical protein